MKLVKFCVVFEKHSTHQVRYRVTDSYESLTPQALKSGNRWNRIYLRAAGTSGSKCPIPHFISAWQEILDFRSIFLFKMKYLFRGYGFSCTSRGGPSWEPLPHMCSHLPPYLRTRREPSQYKSNRYGKQQSSPENWGPTMTFYDSISSGTVLGPCHSELYVLVCAFELFFH